jgi:head-tail adaptor
MSDIPFIKAGQLDTPIDIYAYTNTQNEYGEITQTRSLLKMVWAKLLPKSGSEGVEDSVIVATSKVDFLVRYDDDLELKSTTVSPEEHFTIKYLDKFWLISSMEYQGRGKGILIKSYYKDDK